MRRLLLTAALVALLALSIYGVWSRHLLQQEIWQPPGPRRFFIFLAVLSAWSAGFIFFRKGWLIPSTLAVAGFYSMATVGVLPVAATAFFLTACLVLGRIMLPSTDNCRGTLPDLLALLTGLSALMWLTGILAHFPINYRATYLAILGACLLVKPGTTATCLHRVTQLFRSTEMSGRWDYIMLAVALAPLLAHWLVALKPEVGADALSMHMVVTAYIADHHLWSFDFHHFIWAVMPMGGTWCYTIVYLLGGEFAARLLNLALLAVLCAFIYTTALRWVARPTAFLVTAIFAATPLVQMVTGSLLVENFYALLLFGALAAQWQYYYTRHRPYLVVSAFLLASAMGVKLTALPFVLPASTVLAWQLVQIYRRGEKRWLMACVTVMLAVAPLPYLYSWWQTGNPVFPFLNSIFHSPYFPPVSLRDPRFNEPLSWHTPFDLTFETHRFWEGQDGSAGFQWLGLVPLALLSIRRDWRFVEWTLVATAVTAATLGLLLVPYVRYHYPAFPLLTLSIALIFGVGGPGFRRAAWCVAAIYLGANLYFLPSSSWYHKTFCLNPFDRGEARRYVAASAPARLLVERLNQNHAGESALLHETNDIAGLRGEAWSDGWHSPEFMQSVYALNTEVDALKLFRRLGIHHFIFPSPARGIPVREEQIRRFLADYTDPEADCGSFRLANLRPEFLKSDPAVDAAPVASPPGHYDDFDARIHFFAYWQHDAQFATAAKHSTTYSNIPNATFRFAFHGSGIAWVYTKTLNRGIAEVYIDGTSRGEVDLYSPATLWQVRTTFEGLEEGDHVLEVRILDKKNPRSSDKFVDVDELIVY